MHTILITNDDGIHSPGLRALKESLAPLGRIVIIAPDRDNSAISHALTMNRPLRLTKIDEDVYTLDGTPTDCVSIALGKVLDRLPDLLVSGINSGPNIGDDITYSGTVSAAIEGTMYAVSSMAVSMAGELPLDYAKADGLIRELALRVIEQGLPANTLMNVNIPAESELRGVRITRQGRRIWKQAVQEVRDPRGKIHYWIGGGTHGTLELIKQKGLKHSRDSLILMGEIFWRKEPTNEALAGMGVQRGEWAVGLEGILKIFEDSGTHLVEMVLATDTDWDRYQSKHWWAFERWMRENADDPQYEELVAFAQKSRLDYFRYERPLCGWGVFVLRLK